MPSRPGPPYPSKGGERRLAATASDEQLRLLVSFVARTCLEVERGFRSPEHLRQLLVPRLRDDWRPDRHIGRFGGGAVTRDAVGPPMLSRLAKDEVIATVTTRTDAARWGALTVRLRAIERHWHLLDVQRLLASTHYRQGAIASEAPPEVPLDVKVDRVVEERKLAAAALEAATRRLGELGPRDPERDHLRVVSRRWRTVVAEFTDELTRLRTTEQVSERVRLMRRS